MKANFKKASVFAIAIALVLLMSLSVIPMVSATEEAATTPDAYYELETDYTGDLQESIDAMNISLTGRITLTIYYVIKEDSAHDYIELTVPDLDENGKKTTRKYTEKYDPEKLDENGRYPVSVSVAAAQQTDLIKFQWFDANDNAGKWRSYSVRYYANKIMDLAAAEDPAENVQKMDHTVKSMLNYGAMAQLRFGYNTEKLANEGLFDNTNPVDNMLVDHLYDATANPVVDTFFLGTNVSLEDDIRMKVYVNAPEGTEVTIDDNTEKKTSVRKDAAGTYVGIYNIPANQFAKQFKIAVDGHEPIYYSILGWCKSALESYKTTEEEKNIAKALYQYYTWTTNYTDDTYVPGPKTEDENGKVVSACTHERYYVKGENVVCSDCGDNISATTRVSLVPNGTLTIADGATVTFTLKVVGDVNLSGLIVTPTVTGLTLSNPKVTNIDETGNIVTTVDKNIVIDTQKAVTAACELVKVTYTVTVNEGYNAGSYKIGLTVQDSAGTAPDLVTPVTTVLKVVKTDCTHETKTGYDVTDAGHRWYCDICKQTGAWEAHSYAHVWSSETKLYTKTCVCGKTDGTSDMICKTEAQIHNSISNGITATQEDGFTRYTVTGGADLKDGDFYAYIFKDGTEVTGQYAVIKYRLVGNGKDATLRSFFAGTTETNYGTAKGGTVHDSSMFMFSSKFIGDGEWHYMVVTPNFTEIKNNDGVVTHHVNEAFKPNDDGTYSWQYLRIGINPSVFNGNCYLDIDEVAFADTAEAAEYYARKDTAYNFTTTFDAGNLTLNGTSLLGKITSYTGVWTLDMSDYAALQTPTSLMMGGWACTPGGVKGYYVRVTSVDGVAVENPTLTKWAPATYRIDIYNVVGKGKGYSNLCANGAGMDKTAIDLTAYMTRKVDFELVAITNFGVEVVYTKVINVEVPCTHKAADDAVWTLDENDPMFEKADCLYCDEKAERYVSDTTNGLLLWTPNEIYSKSNSWSNGNVTINNDNGLPYVHYEYTGAQTTVDGECVANLYGNIADPLKVGKYAAILYRTTHTGSVEVYANSNADKVNGPNVNFGGNTNNLNEWTFRVKEFPANADTTKYDAQQQTAVRLDWFNYTVNNPLKTGDTVDIAFIAYFDSEAEAYAFFSKYVKAYGEESWCDHKYINTEWVSAEKIYKTTCTICGNVETSDMLYKTEGITGNNVGSFGNFLTATTVTEDGETFTRYTAVCSPEVKDKNGNVTSNYSDKVGDPVSSKVDSYFYPYKKGTAVTGKYMIIKYRVVNGGTNLSTGATFASSAASGQTGASGNNGDSSMYVAPNTWYADGEWHTIMIQPTDNNLSFTANADGTYTWAYLRIRVNNLAVGGYIDIAEIAFVDNEEAAKCYAYKNDSTVFFTNHLDYVKLGDATTGDKGGSKEKPNSVDLSGKTVTNAAESLKIKGWCVTPGGVAAYKLRVTSIDGKAVEDPELINWATATTVLATDGVTTQGTNRGFGTDCRLGARYNETAVNLSNWAGHTINFEIVAVTNYGAEVTIIQINNVTVLPAAE